jgi:delta(3,5)-delta(2,4)-dienoyl-CoA isomerase
MFKEIKTCMERASDDKHFRALVMSGSGKMFSSGLDLSALQESIMAVDQSKDVSRRALQLRGIIKSIQDCVYSIYKCRKPVVMAVHNGCVGGAMDIISAADIRYCSQDAWFEIKEIDLGIIADIGTLQFVPRAVGNDSIVKELVYTGRRMDSKEAKELGLIGKILPDAESTKQSALDLAKVIASKSPVAVQGAKVCMEYSRDHTVQDGLSYMATWNMSMLQSEDTMKAGMAVATKSPDAPDFDDL